VNGSLIKFFHRNPTYSHVQNPKQKLQKESDKNTNQQHINNPHEIMKLAEKEWDQTGTQLAKYDQNSE
jgi:hypothetical protein